MDEIPINTVVAGAGFAAGLLFGATAQRTNFCTMGAISDIVFMGDFRRMRAWLLAIAVAMIATQAMYAAGLVDINRSAYLTANFGWLGAIAGGLLFGFGMTMAGGCGNKTLVRIGGGNLKSVVVALILGLFAYMTMRGILAVARLEMETVANIGLADRGIAHQGLTDFLMALGLDGGAARLLVVAVLAGGLLVYCLKDAAFRASPRDLAAGLILGLLVPAGWWITGMLGADEFEPVPLASFAFVAPIAESMQYLMTFTGATINFGVATVAGVIAGSFLIAVATKSFRVEAFTDAGDMIRHMVGGAIMGTGGVLAMGCTIGQGLTGLSTLASGSVLAFLSILAGGYLGMKYLEEGSLTGALRAALARA